ncbi:hypothetical protein LELG_05723 [Lodderomyces elongisporus NRRL YB-4239]|uniref:Pre-mRNA-splicing factor SYF1 n=1 Tax=Lodderomyces elongisporus (strain ATCC 11503 / CBS 2605 / JCM 1781 / NBRC 1676 / NRRL YB-4239) TaxID=379508 RepID=A5E7Y4_LODEL|nr:hypothetical protein LELG_05723 [Lodderomyces elongisporus NRRL YB-4239]
MLDGLLSDKDISFEEQLAKDNQNSETWHSYYNFKINQDGPFASRIFIINRAVEALPNDKLLWTLYLELITNQDNLALLSTADQFSIFDQCVDALPKSYGHWQIIIECLLENYIDKVTYIRRKFNQCLQNLPIEEHGKVWPYFLQFANTIGGVAGIDIYLRYMKYIDPRILKGTVNDHQQNVADSRNKSLSMNVLEFIDKLKEFGDVKNVARLYSTIVNSNEYVHAKLPKLKIELVFEYLDFLISSEKNSKTQEKDFNKLINKFLQKYPEQSINLKLKLIQFLKTNNQQNEEKVVKAYSELVKECNTIEEFKDVFNEYAEYEETRLEKLFAVESKTNSKLLSKLLDEYETLLNSRKLYVNDVQLRQDTNNVDFWFTRIEIYNKQEQLSEKIKTIAEAIKSINPLKIPGNCKHKLSDIWKMYAQIYSSSGDFRTADLIISKAVQSQFPHPDELADLYIYWSELRLSSDFFREEQAIQVLSDIMYKEEKEPISYFDSSITVGKRITKSKKLWSFFIDLLESFIDYDNDDDDAGVDSGNREEGSNEKDSGLMNLRYINQVIEAFEQMIKLKIASAKDMMQYALFLETHKQTDKSLSIYERALLIFNDSLIRQEIWRIYMTKLKFINNVERVKDIKERFENEQIR